MLRTAAARPLARSLQTTSLLRQPCRISSSRNQVKTQLASNNRNFSLITANLRSIALRQAPTRSVTLRGTAQLVTTWVRHKSDTKKYPDGRPPLKPTSDPDSITVTSSTHPILSEVGQGGSAQKQTDADKASGIRSDLNTIRETFDLGEVPREAYVLGLLGTLPYLGTSLATVFCAWDINYAESHGIGWLLSEQSAETVLHLLEPLQVGYGAVILSFLGAIHWGLEWAAYGGTHGYPRYAIGLVAPIVAWPTMLMPIEYALMSQFLAFNFLYYADSRATTKGWMPPWYGTYRFILTFIVGASIVVTLIGRGEIADRVKRLPSPVGRALASQEQKAEGFEKEQVTLEGDIEKDEEG